MLLELARVEKARGNPEGMMAALLAASRGGETRAAELAREQLPDRYPYVYEFRKALELDPGNDTLHRELAYLLLHMSEKEPTESTAMRPRQEFKRIVATSPADYVAAAQLGLLYLAANRHSLAMPILRMFWPTRMPPRPTTSAWRSRCRSFWKSGARTIRHLDPRLLGERSYAAGFLKDALRYFLVAREQNPVDASIALKLGWTNNLLHDDLTALHWFDIARHSADPAISAEARHAYGAICGPDVARFRTTLWIYPLYSSRWHDLFGYGQLKTEIRLKKLPFRPYASVRFVGDVTALHGRRLARESFRKRVHLGASASPRSPGTAPWAGLKREPASAI